MCLLHILFLFCLSCVLAEESSDRSLPDSKDSHPLAGDNMELPSVENPACNSDSVNVEDILRELGACRQKNRNLNETIDKILEEMADMKEYILRNEEKITQLSDDLHRVEEDVDGNSATIASVAVEVVQQGFMIEDNVQRLETLSIRGRWCGYKSIWNKVNSIISYDSIFFEETNMNVTPLNNTGSNRRRFLSII